MFPFDVNTMGEKLQAVSVAFDILKNRGDHPRKIVKLAEWWASWYHVELGGTSPAEPPPGGEG